MAGYSWPFQSNCPAGPQFTLQNTNGRDQFEKVSISNELAIISAPAVQVLGTQGASETKGEKKNDATPPPLFMHPILSLSLLATAKVALAAQSIDVSDKNAVIAAAKKAQWPLQMFFKDNSEPSGAWIEQFPSNNGMCNGTSLLVAVGIGGWRLDPGRPIACSDPHPLYSFNGTGEYWDLFYRYMQYSGDKAYLDFVDQNMQLSAGSNGDFLDGVNPLVEESGRWNDDIGWWALSTMTATETFGVNAILAPNNINPGYNPTYFQLTNTTFEEIWHDWDNSSCGGGIWWSRSRHDGYKNDLKSTITNVEEMELGARLYALHQDQRYKDRVDTIYNWLHSSNIISENYTVYDAAQAQFVDSDNVLSREPSCIADACDKAPTGYNWAVYKGLANLYAFTNDSNIRTEISTILRASAKKNFEMCDDNWFCMRNFPAGTQFTLLNGTNPRDQFETIALLNALAVINGAPPLVDGSASNGAVGSGEGTDTSKAVNGSTVAQGLPASGSSAGASSSGGASTGAIVGGIIGAIVVVTVVAAAVLLYRRFGKLSKKEADSVSVTDERPQFMVAQTAN
ncbi:glycosyl hydrolase family 76-domain-containing protein [Chytriomyces sp. MP71]|nr:glycosyl hydrolase family 76-domain-containing protein [Chytriomyces sp. MP71]